MKEPSNIPAGKVKTNPRHIGKTRSVMRILNLKTRNTETPETPILRVNRASRSVRRLFFWPRIKRIKRIILCFPFFIIHSCFADKDSLQQQNRQSQKAGKGAKVCQKLMDFFVTNSTNWSNYFHGEHRLEKMCTRSYIFFNLFGK